MIQQSRPSSRRGIYTILAMFVLGGLVLAGLFLAPRPKPIAAPALPWGLPDPAIEIAAWEVGPTRRNVDPVNLATFIRDNGGVPDLLLLFDVEADQVPALAQALGMQQSFDPRHYQRVPRTPGSREKIGVCMLSRLPVYETSPTLADPKTPIGIQGTLVATGRRMRVGGLWQQEHGIVLLPVDDGSVAKPAAETVRPESIIRWQIGMPAGPTTRRAD